jgi:hypothetical protein
MKKRILISHDKWCLKEYTLVKSYPEFNHDSYNRYMDGIDDTLEDEILSQELLSRANDELAKVYEIKY